MAVGPLAGQGDEQVARDDLAGVDGGAQDRSGRSARGAGRPWRSTRSSAVSPESAAPPVDGACDAGSVTDSSVAYAIAHRPAVSGPGGARRSGSRPGRVIASVAIRRNSSNDMTGISSWPTRAIVGVPSLIFTETTRSGDAGVAADVADEAVVEEVVLPVAAALARGRSQIWAVPGLAADVVALDERPVAVERDLGDDVVHHPDERRRQRRRR